MGIQLLWTLGTSEDILRVFRCEISYLEEASGTLQEIVYNYFSQEIEGLQQIHSGMKLHRFFVSLLGSQDSRTTRW